RKAFVGALVTAGISTFVLCKVDPIMEQRPQRPIGVAVVVLLDVLFFAVDRCGGESPFALHRDLTGELVGLLARPAEPDAPHLAQGGRKRDGEPALRTLLSAGGSRNPV